MTDPNVRVRFVERWDADGVTIVKMLALVVRKTPRGAWCRALANGYSWQSDVIEVGGSRMLPYGKEFFVLDGSGRRKYHERDDWAWQQYRKRKGHALAFSERRYLVQKAAAELCEGVEQPPKSGELTVNPEWNGKLDWSEI